MKTLILLVACILSVSITGAKANARIALEIPGVPWADDPHQAAQSEKNGIELNIHVPEQRAIGEPFRIRVNLANHSKKPAFYELVSGGPNFHIALRDSEGKTIPLTLYGNLRFPPEYGVKEPFVTAQVPVGETRSFLLNLPRCYDLSVAGEYHVSVTVDINPAGFQGFSLKSPPVNFALKNAQITGTEE